jgi:hypothetical protein
MAKSVSRSVRLSVNLSNKINDEAYFAGTNPNALMVECIRRGLLSMRYIPFYKVKTLNQIAAISAALAANSQLLNEIRNDG